MLLKDVFATSRYTRSGILTLASRVARNVRERLLLLSEVCVSERERERERGNEANDRHVVDVGLDRGTPNLKIPKPLLAVNPYNPK